MNKWLFECTLKWMNCICILDATDWGYLFHCGFEYIRSYVQMRWWMGSLKQETNAPSVGCRFWHIIIIHTANFSSMNKLSLLRETKTACSKDVNVRIENNRYFSNDESAHFNRWMRSTYLNNWIDQRFHVRIFIAFFAVIRCENMRNNERWGGRKHINTISIYGRFGHANFYGW